MMNNETEQYTLVLSGISDLPNLQLPLFPVFLLVYLMTLTGNLIIILLICTDSHLQTPMYFFLGTLAFLDMSNSSVINPRLLFDLYTQKRLISVKACITQTYFFLFFISSEVFLLAVMSYDRYAAICHPLHYLQIMHWKKCALLISGVLIFSMVYSLNYTIFLLKLNFCGSKPLRSFFCDLPQLLQVSCSDTFISVLTIFLCGMLFGGGSFVLTFYPYVIILNTILKIQSKQTRSKAFSTCSSHLTVVFIFYGTTFFNYFDTNAKESRAASIFYAVLAPLLNPVIYSLRNQDLKTSLKRSLCRLNIPMGFSSTHAPKSCSLNTVCTF